MNKSFFFRFIRISLILAISFSSCGLKKESDEWKSITDERWSETNASLEKFVQEIDNSPAKWESHLDNLITSLGDESESLLKNEISKMSAQLSMDLGNQFNCSSTVIPDILNKKMSWLSRQLLMKKGDSKKQINYGLPILLCGLDQNRIDLNVEQERRNIIRANGYGFYDSDLVSVRWVKDNSTYLDETKKKVVYKTSDFQYTIDLSEFDDKMLANYDHMAIISSEIVVAELPIIKKVPEKVQSILVNIPDFDHYPELIFGDDDFNGDIKVWISFRLFYNDSKVGYNLLMQAKESGGDKTLAKSWSDSIVIYKAPMDKMILSINNDYDTEVKYNVLENFDMGGNKSVPVDYRVPFRWGSLLVRGETRGKDIGDGDDSCSVKYRSGGKMLSIQIMSRILDR